MYAYVNDDKKCCMVLVAIHPYGEVFVNVLPILAIIFPSINHRVGQNQPSNMISRPENTFLSGW